VYRVNVCATFKEQLDNAARPSDHSTKTVLRVAPCLFGLFSVISLWYAQLPARCKCRRAVDWPGKTEVTFSDAITAVRHWLWMDWVFETPGHYEAFTKIPRPLQAVLLYALAPAA